MREYRYLVDREGRIFHNGTEVVDPLVLRFFLRAMQRTPDGRYLVLCQGERNWFEPHDTPFVVQRLRFDTEDGRLKAVELCFAGEYREPLDPGSLEAEGGYLFCPVRRGQFRARFGRLATNQIAPFLVDGADGPALTLNGARYPIRILAPASPSPLAGEGVVSIPSPPEGERVGVRGAQDVQDPPMNRAH